MTCLGVFVNFRGSILIKALLPNSFRFLKPINGGNGGDDDANVSMVAFNTDDELLSIPYNNDEKSNSKTKVSVLDSAPLHSAPLLLQDGSDVDEFIDEKVENESDILSDKEHIVKIEDLSVSSNVLKPIQTINDLTITPMNDQIKKDTENNKTVSKKNLTLNYNIRLPYESMNHKSYNIDILKQYQNDDNLIILSPPQATLGSRLILHTGLHGGASEASGWVADLLMDSFFSATASLGEAAAGAVCALRVAVSRILDADEFACGDGEQEPSFNSVFPANGDAACLCNGGHCGIHHFENIANCNIAGGSNIKTIGDHLTSDQVFNLVRSCRISPLKRNESDHYNYNNNDNEEVIKSFKFKPPIEQFSSSNAQVHNGYIVTQLCSVCDGLAFGLTPKQKFIRVVPFITFEDDIDGEVGKAAAALRTESKISLNKQQNPADDPKYSDSLLISPQSQQEDLRRSNDFEQSEGHSDRRDEFEDGISIEGQVVHDDDDESLWKGALLDDRMNNSPSHAHTSANSLPSPSIKRPPLPSPIQPSDLTLTFRRFSDNCSAVNICGIEFLTCTCNDENLFPNGLKTSKEEKIQLEINAARKKGSVRVGVTIKDRMKIPGESSFLKNNMATYVMPFVMQRYISYDESFGYLLLPSDDAAIQIESARQENKYNHNNIESTLFNDEDDDDNLHLYSFRNRIFSPRLYLLESPSHQLSPKSTLLTSSKLKQIHPSQHPQSLSQLWPGVVASHPMESKFPLGDTYYAIVSTETRDRLPSLSNPAHLLPRSSCRESSFPTASIVELFWEGRRSYRLLNPPLPANQVRMSLFGAENENYMLLESAAPLSVRMSITSEHRDRGAEAIASHANDKMSAGVVSGGDTALSPIVALPSPTSNRRETTTVSAINGSIYGQPLKSNQFVSEPEPVLLVRTQKKQITRSAGLEMSNEYRRLLENTSPYSGSQQRQSQRISQVQNFDQVQQQLSSSYFSGVNIFISSDQPTSVYGKASSNAVHFGKGSKSSPTPAINASKGGSSRRVTINADHE